MPDTVLLGFFGEWQVQAWRLHVFRGLEAQYLAPGIDLAVKSLALFITGLAVSDHLRHQRNFRGLGMKRIGIRQDIDQALHHVGHQVDSDQVVKTENTGFRYSHGTTKNGVGLERRQPLFERSLQRALDRENPDPVTEKSGRIATGYDTFTQLLFAEITQQVDDGRVGVLAAHQFEQAHETYRVKKVGDGKALAKRMRHVFDQQSNRDRRCIRCDNGFVLTHGVKALVQILLDIETFDHGLGDPVAVGELIEIVAGIAEVDKGFGILADQARLIRVAQTLEATFGKRVCIILGGKVQQPHFDARVGNLACNTGTHRAGADHGDFPDTHRYPLGCLFQRTNQFT